MLPHYLGPLQLFSYASQIDTKLLAHTFSAVVAKLRIIIVECTSTVKYWSTVISKSIYLLFNF